MLMPKSKWVTKLCGHGKRHSSQLPDILRSSLHDKDTSVNTLSSQSANSSLTMREEMSNYTT